MKKTLSRSILLIAASVLAASCATDQGANVQQGASVTRFHLGQQVARGEIRVEPTDRASANSLEFAQMAASVERELTRLGWTVARGNERSEQVAVIRVAQSGRARRGGSGLSVGVGFGGGRGGVGGGVSAGVPIGGAGSIVVTEFGVRIQRRSDATVAWEGRAELEARAGSSSPSPSQPSTGWPGRCFGTSRESRAALSGFDDPLHF